MKKDIDRQIPEECVSGVCTKKGWDVFRCNTICKVPYGFEEYIACANEHAKKTNANKSGGHFIHKSFDKNEPLGIKQCTRVVSYEDRKDERALENFIDSN